MGVEEILTGMDVAAGTGILRKVDGDLRTGVATAIVASCSDVGRLVIMVLGESGGIMIGGMALVGGGKCWCLMESFLGRGLIMTPLLVDEEDAEEDADGSCCRVS